MKKYLAKIFREGANKLDPEVKNTRPYFHLEEFDIREIGLGFIIGEPEIRQTYEYIAVDEAKERIKKGIFLAIEQNNLIDFKINKLNNPFSIQVTGHLIVGIKNK